MWFKPVHAECSTCGKIVRFTDGTDFGCCGCPNRLHYKTMRGIESIADFNTIIDQQASSFKPRAKGEEMICTCSAKCDNLRATHALNCAWILQCEAAFAEALDPVIDQHAPGAKLDQDKVRMELVLSGFPLALKAVGEVATYGAKKYTKDGWKSVPEGFERYTGALLRHLLTEASDGELDDESGLPHAAHACWNSLARLELLLRSKRERIKPETMEREEK